MKLDIAGFAFVVGVIFLIVIFYGDPDLHDLYLEKVKSDVGYAED